MTQKGYQKKVHQKFNINNNIKSVSTPLNPHFKLKTTMSPTTVEERENRTHVPYISSVGSLMYVMVCTRSDLSHVSIVSRYMHDPGRGHWEAVKWILWYINGTIDVDLVFKKDVTSKHECIGYIDSDYAVDFDKHQSTMGYVFAQSQAPVSWRSTL